MPIVSDPSDAIWEASDGTLRTLPDITDHTALAAVTAARAWADDDLADPNSTQFLRDALVRLVQRLERSLVSAGGRP